MKFAGWIVVLAAMAAAPASAQFGSDTEQLIQAVEERDGAKVTELVGARGASVINGRNMKGRTALMVAVQARSDAFVGYLLQNGANPNYANEDGERPLIAAARIGYATGIDWLLGQGAEVNATNRKGETALIVAVQQRHAPIVETLLMAGADPDLTDTVAGYSARDYAKRDSRSRRMLSLIESADNRPKPVQDINDFKLK